MGQHTVKGKSPATWGIVTVLLIIAIAGTLWVPLYAHSLPKLGPFPFFYWYQLIWERYSSAPRTQRGVAVGDLSDAVLCR